VPAPPLAIETRELTKCYGARRAVDRLSLAVPRGSVFGLLGPAGAGKTTALRLLAGRLRPSSGGGSILGHDLLRERAAFLPRVAAVPARPAFYQLLSARDNLRALARGNPARRARVDGLLALVGLGEQAELRLRACPPGARRRLALAAALLDAPDLLLLDEPTRGLAPAEAAAIHDLIRRLGAAGLTILLATTAPPEVAELCSGVGLLSHGRLLAQGPVESLFADRPTLLVEAEPLPILVVVAERMGLAPAPAGPRARRVEAPPELAPRLVSALVSAGASVYQVTPERRSLEQQLHELLGHGG
jgi:ABC-type multidrug transport system ATPase subunit